MKLAIAAMAALVLGAMPALVIAQQAPGQNPQFQPQPGQNSAGQPQNSNFRGPQNQQDPQGQVPGQQRFSQQPQGQQQQGMRQSDDAVLAAWLIGGNRGEIELAQLAEKRAKDDNVKKFAQQMVQAHTALLSQLQGVAGPLGQNGQQSGQHGLLGLHEEIGQQCLADARKELESKQGAEFDKCYMGSQVGAHMKMKATLEVVQKHASPQFQPIVAQALATTKQHLEHAMKIHHDQENEK
ncbi:MAG TPA: DUF4142 domain-containing protein [Pirellulales bacterium]|jgi:putative membrane protein|nr:DUF4142 domain-containing protein [Pirellulales bacterium]